MPEVGQGQDTVEERARLQGWKPKEDYSGDPKNWKPAEEYLKHGDNIAKAQSRKAGELASQIDELKAEMAELKQGNQDFKQFHDQVVQKQNEQRELLIKQLEAAQAKAIDEGKGGEAVNLQNQAAELRRQQAAAAAQRPNNLSPEANHQLLMRNWIAENPWYSENPRLRAIADGISVTVRNEVGQNAPNEQYLSALRKRVMELAGDDPAFRNARRGDPTNVGDEPHSQGGGSGERGYDDLPAEAKAACDRMVKTMGLTVDAYLANYEWDD